MDSVHELPFLPILCRFEDGWTFGKILKVFGSNVFVHRERFGWSVFRSFDHFVSFNNGGKR